MQPLKVRMKYFGPYVDETADFTKFANHPLFLISGRTGSGKTTIFDAMSFALFGETSGQVRDGSQLRSNFASLDDETEVEFQFEHQGINYTLVRKPKQKLHKKRGNGTKVYPESTQLTFYDKDQQEVTLTKNRQVDDKIVELLGLTPAQFRQVVLLPQAQFNQFLLSDSDDKEKTLRTIFQTEIFYRWKEAMKQGAKKFRDELKEKQQRLEVLKEQVPFTGEDETAFDQTPEWLKHASQEVQAVQAEIEDYSRKLKSVSQKEDTVREKIAAITKTNQQLDELKKVNEKLAAKMQQADEMAEKKLALAKLDWVQGLLPTIQQKKTAQERIEALTSSLQKIARKKEELKAKVADLQTQQQKLTADQQQAGDLDVKLEQVNHYAELHQQANRLSKSLDEDKKALAQAEQDVQACTNNLTIAKDKKSKIHCHQQTVDNKLEAVKKEASQASNQLGLLEKYTNDVVSADQKVQSAQANVQAAQNSYQKQGAIYQEAENEFDRINDLWINKQIFDLAKQLKKGMPCPVCGSVDHPQPAQPILKRDVTEEKFNQAKQDAETAKQDLQSKQLALQKAQAELSIQNQNFYKNLANLNNEFQTSLKTPKDCQNYLKQVETRCKQVQKDQEALQEQSNNLQADFKQANEQIADFQQQAAGLKTTVANYKHQIDHDQERIAAIMGEMPPAYQAEDYVKKEQQQIKDEVQSLKDRAEKLTQLQLEISSAKSRNEALESQQKKEVDENRDQLAKAKEKLAEAIEETSFNVTEDQLEETVARGCLKQIGQLRTEVNDYFNTVNNLKSQAADLAEQTKGKEHRDPEKENQLLSEIKDRRQQLTEKKGQLTSKSQNYQKIFSQVKEIWQLAQSQDKRQQSIAALVEQVSGNGADSKLTLERFVLRHYLSQVLALANVRLSQLLKNRYQLDLSSENASFKKLTGLQINVFDEYVGRERPVATLSGGEGFIASLTLAMALAETIQSEHGGVQIESLFIDEGFDSLDAESLSTVLASLEKIESQHRMIGMISHVEGMESEIPNQMRVVQKNGQSHIEYLIDGVKQAGEKDGI